MIDTKVRKTGGKEVERLKTLSWQNRTSVRKQNGNEMIHLYGGRLPQETNNLIFQPSFNYARIF